MAKYNFIDATPKLARIMAGEKLDVLHGNYSTASFDPQNRVLRLPIWEDADKDVYNLLVTHEVGHAMFTPKDWNHDLKEEIPGCPQIILNIVEDIRIEKLIRREYPGTYGMFVRAYQKMLDADRFGIKGIDPNTLGFLNKLNIHAKCGNLVPLNFDEDEQKMVDIAMQIETWDDTLRVTKLLSEFAEERDQQQEQQDGDDQQSGDQSDDQGEGQTEGDQQGSGEDQGEASGQDQDESSSKGGKNDKPSGGDEDEDGSDSSKGDDDEDESDASEGEGEDSGSESDDNGQDEDEGEESDAGQENSKQSAPEQMQKNTDVSTDSNMRQSEEDMALGHDTRVLRVTRQAAHATVSNSPLHTGDKFAYKRFQRSNKAFVQRMVNEFNVRQHARKQKKIEIAKSGRIDPVKLPMFNISDDIFVRYGIDPESQNHAICMYLDCSASMEDHDRLPFVAREVAIMAEFCRTLKIPFQVYGWTSSGFWTRSSYGRSGSYFNDISCNKMKLWVDSTMSPVRYKAAIGALQEIVEGKRAVQMGGTPLTEAKAAAAILSEEYKKAHNADKLHVIFLTDGVGSGNLDAIDGSSSAHSHTTFNVQFDNQKPYTQRYRQHVTDERCIDDHMRKICDNYILIDVGDSNVRSSFQERYDVKTSISSYDSVVEISSPLRSWAVSFSGGQHIEGDTSGAVVRERNSQPYREFRKISGIIGKMVA